MRQGAGTVTRIVVVRHGQTDWNVEMRIQGHGDSRLTGEGIAQAEAIAARLAEEPCDELISSDLGRAHETAKRIASRNGKPIFLDSRLRERAFGAGEGMSYAELDRAYPGSFLRTGAVDPGPLRARRRESQAIPCAGVAMPSRTWR